MKRQHHEDICLFVCEHPFSVWGGATCSELLKTEDINVLCFRVCVTWAYSSSYSCQGSTSINCYDSRNTKHNAEDPLNRKV